MTIKCKVCMQPFLCNASEKVRTFGVGAAVL